MTFAVLTGGYTIGNTGPVFDWIAAHPGEVDRCEMFLKWVEQVCREPEVVITGTVTNQTNGRQFHYSDVGGVVRTRVAFRIFKTPVRAIWILDIDDDLFRANRP